MITGLRSLSSELKFRDGGMVYTSLSSLTSNDFVRIYYLEQKRHCKALRKNAGMLSLSCPTTSKLMEGSFMRKKQLHKPPLKLEFVRTLLVDNYDSYTYNIYQDLSVINGCRSSLSPFLLMFIFCISSEITHDRCLRFMHIHYALESLLYKVFAFHFSLLE